MKIIETSVFTKRINQLLTFEEYRELQNELIVEPEKGKVITGSGGLRKLRWSYAGKGKRGGVRVIYYWIRKDEIIMMLLIYPKNERDDLTKEQLKVLKAIVERELK